MQISAGAAGKAKGSKTTREGGAKAVGKKTSRSASFDHTSGFQGGFKGTSRRASTTNIVDTNQLAKDGLSLKVDGGGGGATAGGSTVKKKKKAKKKRPATATARPRTARR
jgi:hypothetical protein